MMLTEETAVPDAALPLAAFKEHLRLGAGFADDGGQDALLLHYLRAAIAAIEARTGRALLARAFRLRLGGWRDGRMQVLPVAPVRSVAEVVLIGADGAAAAADPARWRLEPDLQRPRIVATGFVLPRVPAGGAVEIVFEAGFAEGWDGLPVDLAQAVMLLAAQYHEARTGAGPREGAIPFGIMALVERWRVLRGSVGGGWGCA